MTKEGEARAPDLVGWSAPTPPCWLGSCCASLHRLGANPKAQGGRLAGYLISGQWAEVGRSVRLECRSSSVLHITLSRTHTCTPIMLGDRMESWVISNAEVIRGIIYSITQHWCPQDSRLGVFESLGQTLWAVLATDKIYCLLIGMIFNLTSSVLISQVKNNNNNHRFIA